MIRKSKTKKATVETKNSNFNTLIIGAGIFGLHAALYLAKKGQKIAVLEKESKAFTRASFVNQARVHNGYHYPRSYETAKKTSYCYKRFCTDFQFSLIKPFKQIYAISNRNSKVNVNKYINFCKKVDLPLRNIDATDYLNPRVMKDAFETEESCFNYEKIKHHLLNQLQHNPSIKIFYNTFPVDVKVEEKKYEIVVNKRNARLTAKNVINATYANINNVNSLFNQPKYDLKFELCELMLCKAKGLDHHTGITILDGLFFSLMPFGKGQVYSLSSVKHTPIKISKLGPQNKICLEFKKLKIYKSKTWGKTKPLVKKYLSPKIKLKYLRSIFEIKPILYASEIDDSRPTLIKIHRKNPYFISVLPGKISTIYDLDKVLTVIS